MATQFMQSPSQGPGMGGGYGYPSMSRYAHSAPNGRSFAFRKRFERVDWRKIASVDTDYISRTLDFNALQENIMNITFCNIESELDLRMVDPNFVKLFKLAQLCVEYLLHSQEYLTGLIASTEEKLQKVQEEQNELNKTMEKQKQELTDAKKESHKRKKLLMAQQQLIHAGSGSYNKCPYCAKAFLNSSFLQSHITRRHTDFANKAASVAVGATDNQSRSPDINNTIEQLKERLRATEDQLMDEKKRKREEAKQLRQIDPEKLKESERQVYVQEMKSVQDKFSKLEQQVVEIDYKNRSKRSNLGDLQDDTDVEKELLQQQREDVAMLNEQLENKMQNVEAIMQKKMQKQEKKWQNKVQDLHRQHADDISRLSNALEQALEDKKRGTGSLKQREEIDKILRESQEKEILLRSLEDEMQQEVQKKTTSPIKSMMMPSDDDDDETTELISAAGTGMTNGTLTQSLHSTYRSGELTLRTTQFLEELRKNPTLKIVRDELSALLQDHLDKIGIPPETRGIADDVLRSKTNLLKTRRQSTIQKYPIFPDFRKQCNQYADQLARERLKDMRKSPQLSQGTSRTQSPSRPVFSTAAPSQSSLTQDSRRIQQQTPPPRNVSSPVRQSQPPKPQPRPTSPQRTMQSTGGTSATGTSVDYTSTQWDSDEDDSEEEDEQPAFQHVRRIQSSPQRNVSPTPKPRASPAQQQPAAAPRGQPVQVRTIMSKSVAKPDDDDDDDDWDDESELDLGPSRPGQRASTLPVSSSPSRAQPTGQNVARLSQSIERQLAGRKSQAKPVGGVDLAGANQKKDVLHDVFDSDEDDWDVSSIEDEKPTKAAPKKAPTPVRASHASDVSSNTYGTSVWGSSSKAASSVHGGTSGTSPAGGRGSFVSVTDVSSDDELDLDNI